MNAPLGVICVVMVDFYIPVHNDLQWNLRIMDTLGPIKSVQIIMVFQVILYEKVPFGTSTKCVDYECTVPKIFGNFLCCIYILHVSTETCHWDI